MSAPFSPDRCRELADRVRNQCVVARWLGEQAVGVIRRELAQAWEAGRTSRPAPPSPAPTAVDEPAADIDLADVVAAAGHADEIDADQLPAAVTHLAAIPFDGYDTLPASHIVQRLHRMSPDELRAAAAYERQHRQRSTVLGMVDQLLTS